jgi:hypothetical protein
MAVTVKNTSFWDVEACSVVKVYRRSWGTYCLHLQSQRVSQISKYAMSKTSLSVLHTSSRQSYGRRGLCVQHLQYGWFWFCVVMWKLECNNFLMVV